MTTHKKLRARILSMALSVAMVLTMMPMQVLATTDGAPAVPQVETTIPVDETPADSTQVDLSDPSGSDSFIASDETPDGDTPLGFSPVVPEQADAVTRVLARISELPTMDELVEQDTESAEFPAYLAQLRLDVAAARAAHDALDDEYKATVDATALAKLTELEGVLEGVLAAMPVPMGLPLTPDAITITVNGTDTPYKGATLNAAVDAAVGGITNYHLITKLTITEGKVTDEDWDWFKDTNATAVLNYLTDFTIENDVTDVADIPNGVGFDESDGAIFPYSIVNVTIPQEITIGDYAFMDCSALETVSFPAAPSIGKNAFYQCTALETIDFPAATSIGNGAFNFCTALETIDFPAATSIGNGAFADCAALKSVSLPAVTSIGRQAFLDCNALKSVDFPAATSIGEAAFVRTALESVSFPLATSIGNGAFMDCSALESVTIPLATSIGDSAFASCSKLETASFLWATSIGINAFGNCVALESVTIPLAASIGNGAFADCAALKSVSFPLATSIGMSAFRDCTALETASFPAVTSIVGWAFNGCTALDTLKLGAAVPTVADVNAFTGCPLTRSLIVVNEHGNALTGVDSTTALTNYDKVVSPDTGDDNDKLWYGWELTELPKTFASIAVTTPPTKTTYTAGETFDNAGMVVTATYSDTTTAVVTGYTTTPSGALATSDTKITVSYTEDGATQTADVGITVNAAHTISGGGGGGGSTPPAGNVIDNPVGNTGSRNPLANAASAAVAAGKASLTSYVNYTNYSALTKDGLKAINDAAAAAVKDTKLQLVTKVQLDNSIGGIVTSRITVDPAKLAAVMPDKLGLKVWFDQQKDTRVTSVNEIFDKYFTNKLVTIAFEQSPPLAVKMELALKLDLSGLDTNNLHFYSYNPDTNQYFRIWSPAYWVDKNGYSHITAPFGGSVIVTDRLLTKK